MKDKHKHATLHICTQGGGHGSYWGLNLLNVIDIPFFDNYEIDFIVLAITIGLPMLGIAKACKWFKI